MPSLRKSNPHLAAMTDEELKNMIWQRAIESSRFEGARFSRKFIEAHCPKTSRKKISK